MTQSHTSLGNYEEEGNWEEWEAFQLEEAIRRSKQIEKFRNDIKKSRSKRYSPKNRLIRRSRN